jgi:hypothetical protein
MPTHEPSSSPAPSPEPPILTLIQPEQPGTLVTVNDAVVEASSISASVTIPERPGLYRLVVSIHDFDGVAYDAATQALIPALIVHVAGDLWADYRFIEPASTTLGAVLFVPVRLGNTGATPWESDATWEIGGGNGIRPGPRAHLEIRWLALGGARQAPDVEPPTPDDVLLPVIDPGTDVVVRLSLDAPSTPGDYLLVLDVVSPVAGSLAASGVPPGLLRVHVGDAVPAVKPPPQTD